MVNRQDTLPSESAAGGHAPERASGAVEALIERFGGLRPMADKLSVPVSTVQGWKKRGAIPGNRQGEIRAAMEKLQLGDPDSALEGVFRHDDPPAAPPPAPAVIEAPVVEAAVVESPAIESPAAEPAVIATITAPPPAAAPESEPAVIPPAAVAPEPVAPEPVAAAAVPAVVEAPPAPVVETPAPAPLTSVAPSEEVSVPQAVVVASPVTENVASSAMEKNAPATEEKAPPSQGAGAAIAAAVLAIIGAAVSVTAPLWSHEYLQRSINVAVIEKRTGDVEAAVGLAASQRVALTERLGSVEKAVAGLETRVARGPAVVGALAVRDLRAAFANGAPFTNEALAVRAVGLAGKDEEAQLAALAPYAAKGVPTIGAIREGFAWTASGVVGAGLGGLLSSVPADLPARVWDWASGMADSVTQTAGSVAGRVNVASVAVALRLSEPGAAPEPQAAVAPPVVPAPAPVVAATPAPVAAVDAKMAASSTAVLAEAGDMLRQGDLAAAIAVMGRLEGDAADRVAPWLADAQARLTADRLSASLADRVARALQ